MTHSLARLFGGSSDFRMAQGTESEDQAGDDVESGTFPFRDFLVNLGWEKGALIRPEDWPAPYLRRHEDDSDGEGFRPWFLVHENVRQLIVAEAEQPLAKIQRTMAAYRDYPPEVYSWLDWIGIHARTDEHVLISDEEIFYLYTMNRREPLLHGYWDRDASNLLQHIFSDPGETRQRLSELPRASPAALADQLKGFFNLVRYEIGGATKLSHEAVETLLLRLYLVAFHARREPRDGGPFPPIRLRWEHLEESAQDIADDEPDLFPVEGKKPEKAADPFLSNSRMIKVLKKDFSTLFRRYSLKLFDDTAENPWGLEDWDTLIESAPSERWLYDIVTGFQQIMFAKLDPDVAHLALLSDEDHRLSMQSAVALNRPQREAFAERGVEREGGFIYSPLRVDVKTEGMGWGLDLFLLSLEAIDKERRRQKQALKQRGNLEITPDLFQEASIGADQRGHIEDPLMVVLGDALRWTGIDGETARLHAEALIALTAWNWLWSIPPKKRPRHASLAAIQRLFA